MVLRTSDYTNLTSHLTVIDEVFNDAMADSLDEMVGLKIFENKLVKNRSETIQLNHGIAGVQRIPENANYPEAQGQEGDSITFTQAKYGADVVLTKENVMFDEFDQVEDNVRTVVDEGMHLIDQSLSEVLLNGWSTSYTNVYGDTVTAVGPDGLALMSKLHTNGSTSETFNNIITDGTNDNPLISREAIVRAKADALKYRDPNGLTRPVRLDTLLVGPKNEDLATRIIESNLISGSGNNDTNQSIRGRMNIIVWDKLDQLQDGTDTSDYWFMYESKKIGRVLKVYFSQFPMLHAPKELDPNKNNHFLFDYLYSYGFSWAPYLRGSNGTQA